MSTQTADASGSRRAPVPSTGAHFGRVVRSEWTKFWSLRSTMWSLIATVVVTVGLTTLIAWGISSNFHQMDPGERATFDPTNNSLAGLAFGQLAIAVLGVLVISGEYSTGGIRSTLTAVPQRLKVLAAKGLIFVCVALVVGMVICFAAFFVGQAFFATVGAEAHIGDPGVLRAIIGGGLYLAGSGMYGFALGSLLRHTAGAITTMVALLLVVPPLTNLIPGGVGDAITKYFTSNAGQQVTAVHHTSDTLSAWPGYIVFTVEWVIVMVVAAVLMERRDA